MASMNGKFRIDIPATSDLVPPALECSWEAEFEGDPDLEKMLRTYFVEQYEKSLQASMAAQSDALQAPVQSMQREVDQAREMIQAIRKQRDVAPVRTLLQKLQERYPKGLDDKIKEYNDYLAKAVENIRKQQLLVHAQRFEVAAMAAARKQIRKDISAKKFRVVGGLALKGSLALAGAGAAVAASIASFGAALPALAGIGAASAGLGGIATGARLVKSVLAVRDLEARAMKSLLEDLAAITGTMDGLAVHVKGLSEHFDQLTGYYSQRRQQTAQLEQAMATAATALRQRVAQVAPLQQSLPALYQAEAAGLKALEGQLSQAQAAWEASMKREAMLKQSLENTARVVVEVSRLPAQSPKGSLDALKRIDWAGADSYIALAEHLSNAGGMISNLGTSV